MRDRRFGGANWVLSGVALVALLAIGRSANSAEPCCFTNPAFAGTCRVMPGQNEDCSSILAYLNDPNSSGKTYCGTTAIRGGWRQAACGGDGGGQVRSAGASNGGKRLR